MKFLKLTAVLLSLFALNAQAELIYWTDWQSSEGNEYYGTITTTTSTVDVTYYNPQGISFYQTGTGSDYFRNDQPVDGSPYTSDEVDNIPTASEMIALRFAGLQTMNFSEDIANPVFSYVSLNGNGYAFDQDFEILSYGHSEDGNYCGNWGCGTSFKDVVELSPGVFEYRLLGTGEPHGTIMFTGAFDSVSWTSLSNENWNGFTVGVQGTAGEIFDDDPPTSTPISEPETLFLLILAMSGIILKRK